MHVFFPTALSFQETFLFPYILAFFDDQDRRIDDLGLPMIGAVTGNDDVRYHRFRTVECRFIEHVSLLAG